jgi:hypothetical protein
MSLGGRTRTFLEERVRITLSPERGGAHPIVIHTVECWWDVAAQRFTMVRGIYDGYYPMQVESVVQPLEVHVDPDGLRVVVVSAEDARSLSRSLEEASTFCQKSYESMQV